MERLFKDNKTNVYKFTGNFVVKDDLSKILLKCYSNKKLFYKKFTKLTKL